MNELILTMVAKGIDVFGSYEKFNSYMNTHIPFFGKKPIELTDTEENVKLIIDELGRIEHGIFA